MENLLRKITSLADLKYKWLIGLSVIIFAATLNLDYYNNPAHTPFIALASYGAAIMIAGIWAIFNYISHIKINVLYRQSNDISSFVERLALDKEEKIELLTYMEDYTQDLMNQGKTKQEAAAIAIYQFKMKEFDNLAKDTTIFKLPAHYYLWGYTLILGLFFTVSLIISNVWIDSLFIIVIESVSFSYAFGFATVFFLYKLIDVIIYKKF